jgi:hypothetical protein
MNKLMQRVVFDRSGLWLATAAVLFVIAWRGWVVAHNKPAHWEEIIGEFASIPYFEYGLHPNHTDTGLVYPQDTEKGVGIFFCDIGSGKRALVCEQKEEGWSWQRFGMLGWSPDDSLFACAYPPNDPKQPGEEILLCNGITGEIVAKLEAVVTLAEFTWLTPRSFVYSSWDGDSHNVQVIEQKPDGNWVQARTFRQIGNKQMKGLTATSSNSVAWRQEGSIWALDFADGSPQKIWECTTNQLVGFTYSDETREFLLNCSDEKGQFLIRFYPQTKWTADAGRISDQTSVIQNVTWFNDGTRYVYLAKEQGINVFYIKAKTNSELTRLSWPGTTGFCTLSGDHLFINGNLMNQPLGIWEYDIKDGNLSCVVSALEHPAGYAKWVAPVDDVLTNQLGNRVGYHLWQPVQLTAGKKYPVVIAQTTYDWQSFPQIAANEGYYYAIVERPGWYDGLDSWADDVMSLYNILSRNPNIDTNRAFLYACSVETTQLPKLFAEQPDLWKGALILTPTVLPDLSNVRLSSMLIVDGKDESKDTLQWLIQYQDKAARLGVRVNLAFLDGAHQRWSVATERERVMQVALFLLENKY